MTIAYIALDPDGDFVGPPHVDEHDATCELRKMDLRGTVVKFVSLAAVIEQLTILRDDAISADNEAEANVFQAAIDRLDHLYG